MADLLRRSCDQPLLSPQATSYIDNEYHHIPVYMHKQQRLISGEDSAAIAPPE